MIFEIKDVLRGSRPLKIVSKGYRALQRHPYCILTLLACGYYLLFFRYGVDLDDEGFLLVGADHVLHGQWPLSDFFSYPPLSYFLIAAGLKAFGNSVLSERIVLMAILLLSTALLLFSARCAIANRWSVLPAVLFALAPGPWYKIFFDAHLIAMLAGIILYINKSNVMRLGILSMTVGVAAIGRVEAAIEGLLICIPIVLLSEGVFDGQIKKAVGRLAVFLLLVCLIPAAAGTLYMAAGKWPALIESLRYYDISTQYARIADGNALIPSLLHQFSLTSLFRHPTLINIGFFVGLLSCLLNILTALPVVLRHRIENRQHLIELSIGAFGIAGAAYAYFFMWDSRLLQCFAIVYLNVVLLLEKISLRISKPYVFNLRVGGQILLTAFVVSLTGSHFYSGSLTTLEGSYTVTHVKRLKGIFVPATYAIEFNRLRQLTKYSGSSTYIVPLFGGQTLAYASGLMNPTYYTWVDLELAVPGELHRAIAIFKHFKISYFVVRRTYLTKDGNLRMSQYPRLGTYLREHYTTVPLGGLFALLVRN